LIAASRFHVSPGEHGELGLRGSLAGLRAGEGDDEAVGMLGDVLDVRAASSQRHGGGEPDEKQGAVAGAGEVGFVGTVAVLT
jgi:hypothetical protein